MDNLEEKAKELKREYFRQYRKNNRDRIRENEKKCWIRKAEEALKKENK